MNKLFFTLILILSTGIFTQLRGQMCPATPGTELITNGNFEAGYTGFTNDFTVCGGACGSLPGDQYVIGTNPNNHNGGYFANMADHTPVGSNMLIFDFNASSQTSAVYRTTVNVVAGQTYFFSAWFANIAINNTTPCGTCPGGVYIINSPQLEFKITGGGGNPNFTSPTVKVDSLTNNWNQYFTTYTAFAAGPVTIEIVNLRGGNQSNDLALDDISFTNGCDKITDLSALGQSSVLPDQLSTCNVSFPYELDPGLPGTYGYTWKTAPASPVGSGTTYNVPPTPAANSKVYLCYEYVTGCPRVDSVQFIATPINVDLGSDVVMCAPVNHTIVSGVSVPPATIQWYKDNVLIPGATSSTYNATDVGLYRADVARTGCGTDSDEMIISNPVSSFSGIGTYCTSPDQADFSVSGATAVKWYTVPSGGVALNPGDSNPDISLAYTATNTSVTGCASGLYAEDIGSYPGAVMPTAPCAGSNYNGAAATLIEVNQSMTLSSVDFFQNTGWGDPTTFTLNIYNNGPTAGPWCGGCSPAGNYDGPTGASIYTTSSGALSTGVNVQRTLATNVTLAPGRYWLTLTAAGGAMGYFGCTPAYAAGSNLWNAPYVDNTGNNVVRVISALQGGNNTGAGALLNMNFQVGSNNSCDRLFICATEDCPAPVEFLSFDVNKYTNANYLAWKTATEQNSDYFVVERSVDGENFEELAQLPAAGNSSAILSYSYMDYTYPSAAVLYYRIREVDLDGATTFSKIQSLQNEVGEISLFPVPVKQGQRLTLQFIGSVEEAVTVDIFNNLGQIILQKEYQLIEGANTIEINTAAIPAGSYHLKMSGSFIKVAKFLVE